MFTTSTHTCGAINGRNIYQKKQLQFTLQCIDDVICMCNTNSPTFSLSPLYVYKNLYRRVNNNISNTEQPPSPTFIMLAMQRDNLSNIIIRLLWVFTVLFTKLFSFKSFVLVALISLMCNLLDRIYKILCIHHIECR